MIKKYFYSLFIPLISFQFLSFLLIPQVYAERGVEITGAVNTKGGTRSSDGRYTDNGDGTITDSQTGLMWTKKDSYADTGDCMHWDTSKSYVNRLSTGGHSDWRLPTAKELKAIFEKSKNNKDYIGDTIHNDPIFASGGARRYWSSESAGSCCVRNVYFNDGSVYVGIRYYCFGGGVRAVRP